MTEPQPLHLAAPEVHTLPGAAQYAKNETVQVCFALAPGCIESVEGPNHYDVGDGLITGSTGGRWSVQRSRFFEKYAPAAGVVAGEDGFYVSIPVSVWAVQMQHSFTLNRKRGGDVLRGKAGDWVLQYGANDYGVAERSRFEAVYKPLG